MGEEPRLDPEAFDRLHEDVRAYLDARELYVQDLFGGADPAFRRAGPVHHAERVARAVRAEHVHPRRAGGAGALRARASRCCTRRTSRPIPARHGTRTGTFIVIDFGKKLVLIGGTRYAGEMKKSIFTVLNYLLPAAGRVADALLGQRRPGRRHGVFFGLSGTGKTTLSADPSRQLIGDDEHGWSDRGVFNFEGGCYAKVIRLRAETEPEIYAATQMFGTVLENVVLDPGDADRRLRLRQASPRTPAPAIRSTTSRTTQPSGAGGHPKNIVFLTADAFGVLPPIARLTAEQAMYHFLSGYTAKVAGTERGVTEPAATFSACFGAPFLPLHPRVYAKMLGERIAEHGAKVWLVNTGWTGGPYGIGSRMKLAAHPRDGAGGARGRARRRRVHARIPSSASMCLPRCPTCPPACSTPRGTWTDPAAYDAQARKLARMFRENFEQFAAAGVRGGRRGGTEWPEVGLIGSGPIRLPDSRSHADHRGHPRSTLGQHPRSIGPRCWRWTPRRSSGCATCARSVTPSSSIPVPPTPASSTPSAPTT